MSVHKCESLTSLVAVPPPKTAAGLRAEGECRLLAPNRPAAMSAIQPLLGGKRTHGGHVATAVFDPEQNSGHIPFESAMRFKTDSITPFPCQRIKRPSPIKGEPATYRFPTITSVRSEIVGGHHRAAAFP